MSMRNRGGWRIFSHRSGLYFVEVDHENSVICIDEAKGKSLRLYAQ